MQQFLAIVIDLILFWLAVAQFEHAAQARQEQDREDLRDSVTTKGYEWDGERED